MTSSRRRQQRDPAVRWVRFEAVARRHPSRGPSSSANRGFAGDHRAIASKAGVDPALVHYFFKTKDKLFAEAVEMPVAPEQLEELLAETVREGKGKGAGSRFVRFMLEHVFTSKSHAVAALIRAAVADPASVPALRSLIEKTVVTGAASAIRGPDARLRPKSCSAPPWSGSSSSVMSFASSRSRRRPPRRSPGGWAPPLTRFSAGADNAGSGYAPAENILGHLRPTARLPTQPRRSREWKDRGSIVPRAGHPLNAFRARIAHLADACLRRRREQKRLERLLG